MMSSPMRTFVQFDKDPVYGRGGIYFAGRGFRKPGLILSVRRGKVPFHKYSQIRLIPMPWLRRGR